MYNFYYKPRFYFLNSHILGVLSAEYQHLAYPATYESIPDLTRHWVNPTVYYDLGFYFYITSLIRGEVRFLGLKPNTFLYFVVVGFFIRMLWFFGAARRFYPVYTQVEDSRLIGFYDVDFTPLAQLSKIAYYLKVCFFGFSVSHYVFNPQFWFYSRQNATIGQDDFFLSNRLLPFHYVSIFKFIVWHSLLFILSVPFHVLIRPFIWAIILAFGRFWFRFVSKKTYPFFSFEYLWFVTYPHGRTLPIGSLTDWFFRALSAYRFRKSVQFMSFFGLVRPGVYFNASAPHYKYTNKQATNEVFEIFKFQFVETPCGVEAATSPKYFEPSPSARSRRLNGLRDFRHSAKKVIESQETFAVKLFQLLSLLGQRSVMLISKRSASLSIFFITSFFVLKTVTTFLWRFFNFFSFVLFGPWLTATAGSGSRFVALIFTKPFFSFYFNRFAISNFRTRSSVFFLYIARFVSDIFYPFFSRLYSYAQVATQYAYLTRLKKLFQKTHYHAVYSSYFHEDDAQALASHLDTLEAPELDPEDFYDTDLAEGDDYSASFMDSDFTKAGLESANTPNSGVYDHRITANFFSKDNADREASISNIFLLQSLLPNFYEFYRRRQYNHISIEFWHHNHDWHEDPGYEGEDAPIDYETSAPNDRSADRLIHWSNSYHIALTSWEKRRRGRSFEEFTLGSGFSPALDLGKKLSQSDWRELTLFVAGLSDNPVHRQLSRLTSVEHLEALSDQIWRGFGALCRTQPDVVFKRIALAHNIPSVFENAVIYSSPTGATSFPRALVTVFRWLFGARFYEQSSFKFVLLVISSFGLYTPQYVKFCATASRIDLEILSDYFSRAKFQHRTKVRGILGRRHTQLELLLFSGYLRQLAFSDFELFWQRAAKLGDFSELEILRVCARYKEGLLFEPSSLRRSKKAVVLPGFFDELLLFILSLNSKSLSDYFYRFWITQPQVYTPRIIVKDESTLERTKISSLHPRDSLISYFFLPSYFQSLFGSGLPSFLFSTSWFSRNRLPRAVGPFPRADDASFFQPELRAPSHVVNPFPNTVEGWLGLTPFFSSVQTNFFDPYLINLTLPSQFSWLTIEDTYHWDVEIDTEQLDMYDEYLDTTTEFWLDDEEDLAPPGPYEGQLNEDDIDSLSTDPDATELGYDFFGEGATHEDLNLTDEEPWDNEYAEDTHLAYYATDHEEFSVENYSEDEWGVEDFNLFVDASIPLARLFFGGLKLEQAFPATDPRIFLGAFENRPFDRSIHFTVNFDRAKTSTESLSLVTAGPLVNGGEYRSSFFTFFTSPLISVFLRAAFYIYVFFKDLVYASIFSEFQARKDVQKTKMHFQALNHYFRWSSFYGNKYYFKKFSSSLIEWLQDFESYSLRTTRNESLKDFNIFGYFRIFRDLRKNFFAAFANSLPLAPFWHTTDSSLFNHEDEGGYVPNNPLPNYDHVDKWSLYERQRFTKLLDLPMYSSAVDPYADESEGSFLDLMPPPNDDDFSSFDDALLFSYASEGDFLSHLDEFSSKFSIILSAFLDTFDIIRDYTNYGVRLFFNYYILGIFRYWTIFSDSFWLRISLRLGFWTNIFRYSLLISVYAAAVIYSLFVLPRLTYYLFGGFFSTSVILIINGLLSAVFLLGFAFLLFSPLFSFFAYVYEIRARKPSLPTVFHFFSACFLRLPSCRNPKRSSTGYDGRTR